MRLLYLWILDYRKIKQQGFSFSSDLNFTITPKPNDNGYWFDIDITLNEDYQDIFEGASISVTGIVGKNGSGKSTLMHCIKMLYGRLPRLTCPLIFSFLDPESKVVSTYFYQKGGVEEMMALPVTLKTTNQASGKYKFENPRPYNINRMADDHGRVNGLNFEFKNMACGYVTNSFERHPESIYHGIQNYSTTFLLDKYLNKQVTKLENKAIQKPAKIDKKILLYHSHLTDFYNEELQSNVRFLAAPANAVLIHKLNLPEKMTISFNFDDYDYLIDNDGQHSLYFNNAGLAAFHKKATNQLYVDLDKKRAFVDILYLCAFYHSIRHNILKDENFKGRDAVKDALKDLVENAEEVFPEIRKFMDGLQIKQDDEQVEIVHQILGKKLQNALDKATMIDDNLYLKDLQSFVFKIDYNLLGLIFNVFQLKHTEDIIFLNYSWGYDGLSAGEEAQLNFFSRLHEIKRAVKDKPLMLLIDEGELYFHPQWQKFFLTWLLDCVKIMFAKNQVQIILTTHSPFIVSDLPKQNLVFLRKDDSGNCGLPSDEIQTETLGANIHELFTNSFFLQDGLMGEHAREYIQGLIKEIKKTRKITREKYHKVYKNKVNLIGEQFLKTKILELVASKADFNLIDEIIESRSTELDMLKSIRNQKKNDQN
ncbi:AAA ATPase domain-containing protein [Pedobacter terrae]|uniref:AAA ATPase domain-containing protein n=1 Tax=Pedobacter terrae TaxID=405671 RepID=A0A1G7NUF5_9SPHI|nr:AAA family ATPase [Pedobacter terrae]SDF77662.1 AAA ATPase domain-containing protein [Pedobacter terrae]